MCKVLEVSKPRPLKVVTWLRKCNLGHLAPICCDRPFIRAIWGVRGSRELAARRMAVDEAKPRTGVCWREGLGEVRAHPTITPARNSTSLPPRWSQQGANHAASLRSHRKGWWGRRIKYRREDREWWAYRTRFLRSNKCGCMYRNGWGKTLTNIQTAAASPMGERRLSLLGQCARMGLLPSLELTHTMVNKRRHSHSRSLSERHQHGWTWQYKMADCLPANPFCSPSCSWGNQRRVSLVSWQPVWCSLCQVGHSVEGLDIKGKFCQMVQIASMLESKQCLPLLGYSIVQLINTTSTVTFQEELSLLALAQKLPGSQLFQKEAAVPEQRALC